MPALPQKTVKWPYPGVNDELWAVILPFGGSYTVLLPAKVHRAAHPGTLFLPSKQAVNHVKPRGLLFHQVFGIVFGFEIAGTTRLQWFTYIASTMSKKTLFQSVFQVHRL